MDPRSAEQIAEGQVTPEQERNKRRAARRTAARRYAKHCQDLSAKPTKSEIRKWRRRFREWQKDRRTPVPQPPRKWLWGLVGGEPA